MFVAYELVLASSEDLVVCVGDISDIAGDFWFLKLEEEKNKKALGIFILPTTPCLVYQACLPTVVPSPLANNTIGSRDNTIGSIGSMKKKITL